MFHVQEPEAVGVTDIKFCRLDFQVIPDKKNLCNFHFGHNAEGKDVYGWGYQEGSAK